MALIDVTPDKPTKLTVTCVARSLKATSEYAS